MKRTLVLLGILAGAVGAYAQGTLNWSDGQGGYLISIMSPNPAAPTTEQFGNTTSDQPSGAANYGGGWVGGTDVVPGGGVGATPANFLGINYQLNDNFQVGLYVDTSLVALQNDIRNGSPLATTGIQGGANAGIYGIALLTYSDPNLSSGTPVYVGIAAWDTVNGGPSASSVPTANELWDPWGYVMSTITVLLGTPSTPADLSGSGITSFSLAVPEPGTVTLGVIGASLVLLRLRRKQ